MIIDTNLKNRRWYWTPFRLPAKIQFEDNPDWNRMALSQSQQSQIAWYKICAKTGLKPLMRISSKWECVSELIWINFESDQPAVWTQSEIWRHWFICILQNSLEKQWHYVLEFCFHPSLLFPKTTSIMIPTTNSIKNDDALKLLDAWCLNSNWNKSRASFFLNLSYSIDSWVMSRVLFDRFWTWMMLI